MECALGEGGQYQSFEAVFGRRGKDGSPERLFDRQTGKVSDEVVRQWKKYDINRLIIREAESLRSALSGKINIAVADNDDFFLDGSVKLLKKTLDSLSINSNILILNEGGHDTWSDEIRKEMHCRFEKIYRD